MKTTRNLLLVSLLAASTFACAQKHDVDPKERATKHAETMKKELSLNDDQFAKVKAINEKYTASAKTLRSDTAISVGMSHTRMKKLMDEQQAELRRVLTPEQWTQWTALKEKRKEEFRKTRHHHGDEKKD